MNCDDIRALLAARADGELGAADSLRMETHLGT
ncbi:MAG: zf-HC2 domain-containing protein, partial [Pseudomonadota bacterium]